MRPLLLLALPLVGCAEVLIDVDPDKDGLPTAEEVALGSDPSQPDSDGDEYLDGDEVAQNTNPADGEDHPYTGGWSIDACRADLEATGTAVGDVAENYMWLDQFGEMVKLWDFCDRVVWVVFGAPW